MDRAAAGRDPGPRRAADLFAAALERPEGDRDAFLDGACGGDAVLRADVASLLAALPAARRLFDGAPHLARDTAAGDADSSRGADDPSTRLQVGPWRLVRRLAAGGMGEVYLGERVDAAFRKQVAVKLINPWLDSADIVARFERERQVLADLEHPHIARLLDGGATADGRPWLVMEYVDGEPIDAYADGARLPVAARLRLFLTVCEAVQHAHRNLVVHRDLKPGNILVDRQGQVKLLDFGIAKVLRGEAPGPGPQGDGKGAGIPVQPSGDPALTLPGAMTPRYASPEQSLGRRVTAASDIYSLGVVLHELLAGSPPGREVPRLRASAAALEAGVEAAARRGASPARLSRCLAGDLDAIIAKSLDDDPERRYASVDELASDLRRHLDGLPVAAMPNRPGYRVGRFVRRHRVLVAATTTTLLILAASLAVTVDAWREAGRRARDAEHSAYASSLAAAESALRENSVDEAAMRLDASPPGLRGWEWRHLRSRLDRSRIAFRAHAEGITCARFTPDGGLLTAATDGTVRLWDAADGAPRRTWGPFGAGVESLAQPPDGAWIAAGLGDGRVLVLGAGQDSSVTVIHEGGGWASVSVSRDGRRLAAAHMDGRVRVWDVATLDLLREWRAHDGFAQVAWAAGDRLVTGGADGAVRTWDASSGNLQCESSRHTRRVYCLAVSADGTMVASGGMDQLAVVHETATGAHVVTFHEHTGTVANIAFTAGGRQLLTCGPDGRLLRWDARSGSVLAELRGHRADVSAIAVDAGGAQLASGDWGGTLRIWDADACDVPRLRPPAPQTLVPRVSRVAVDAAGRLAACATDQPGVAIWRLGRAGAPPVIAAPSDEVTCLAFLPPGDRLLAGTSAGMLMRIEPGGAVVDTLRIHRGAVSALAVHPSGRWLATAGDDGRVSLRELDRDGAVTGAARDLAGAAPAVHELAFTPGAPLLAAASADSTVMLWQWESSAPPRRLRGHAARVLDLDVDAAGARLASIAADGSLRTWSLPGGEPLRDAFPGRNSTGAVSWSRDGSRLAIGGIDGVIRIMDSTSLEELAGLRGHVARVTSLVFADGDECLVSGSRDGTMRLWLTGGIEQARGIAR